MEKLISLKTELIKEINNLSIKGLVLKDLNVLPGSYINLEYQLPNGQIVKLLNDDEMYLANQIELEGNERCYGVVGSEKFLLVCEYGCNGQDAEIVLYKRR